MYKVLVPLAIFHPRPGSKAPMHSVRATYINQLVRRGMTPLLVSCAMSSEMLADAYAESSALLYMGGSDINARTYGQANHLANECAEPERDVVELALLRLALADRKPFLGICRGAQMLAIASGGWLHQHIPDLHLSEEHGIGEGNGYEHLTEREGHSVKLTPGSRIQDIIGSFDIVINSGHHQAIASVGPDVVVSGTTSGGVVEFIESRDPGHFCMGVQGHPEVTSPSSDAIFDAFAEAVRGATRCN